MKKEKKINKKKYLEKFEESKKKKKNYEKIGET